MTPADVCFGADKEVRLFSRANSSWNCFYPRQEFLLFYLKTLENAVLFWFYATMIEKNYGEVRAILQSGPPVQRDLQVSAPTENRVESSLKLF